MKKKVSILIIDDAKQDTNIQALKLRLNNHCTPEIVSIFTGDVSLRRDGSDHLDSEKLFKHLTDKIERKRFDWIATDYDLGESDIDGIDIIRHIASVRQRNNRNNKKNVLLYSGNIEKAIKKVLDECGGDSHQQAIISAVKKLYDLPIVQCVKRDDYQQTLLEIVSKHCEPTMEDEFLKMLYEHGDIVFNSCYPEFSGKKLSEIADIIEQGSDARSYSWKRALIEQTIAYLIRVNE